MRRYVPKLRQFYKGSPAMQATLAEARRLVESRAGQPAPAAQPSRPPPGAAAVAAAAGGEPAGAAASAGEADSAAPAQA